MGLVPAWYGLQKGSGQKETGGRYATEQKVTEVGMEDRIQRRAIG